MGSLEETETIKDQKNFVLAQKRKFQTRNRKLVASSTGASQTPTKKNLS